MWCEGAELPVETFFRNYQYDKALLSPDGNYLGVLAPDSNRVGLAIIDLANHQANWAFADRQADVADFFWITTNRLGFRLARDNYMEGGLMAVDRDGKRSIRLIGPVGAAANIGRRLMVDWGTHYRSLLPDSTNEFLVTSFEKTHQADSETLLRFPDIYRMNFFTSRTTFVMKNPGHVRHWVLDSRGVPRAGIGFNQTRIQVVYRQDEKAPWEKIADYNFDEDGIEPVAVTADNQALYVVWRGGEEHSAIYTFDPKTKKTLSLGFRHPKADVSPILSEKHQLLGVTCEAEKPEVFWFEPNRNRWQKAIDAALTNTVNELISVTREDTKAVFLAHGDRSPGTYYLMDTKSMRLEKLFELAEWIHPQEMSEMKPIEYTARDGLLIHGYLTLPNGSSGTNLPLIVNPHGGPQERDEWGFHPGVQFLANRGYAVLQMNFRGSTGFGESFRKAGNLEWGLKQQDDITDGVKWAIAQGIADPKRICIFGVSYGGYAALVGLENTPELYRCGISCAGVIDLERTFGTMGRSHFDWTMRNPLHTLQLQDAALAEMVGEKKEQKPQWRDVSPGTHVDRIQVPVLLAYSEYDPRVPIETARDLAKDLKKRGKLYDFMVKDNEDHGFRQEANKIELWKKIDGFLKTAMPQ